VWGAAQRAVDAGQDKGQDAKQRLGCRGGPLCAEQELKAADPKLRTVVVTAIELLSGIPSVVFGLLGMQVLVPAVAKTFGKASGACLLDRYPWCFPL